MDGVKIERIPFHNDERGKVFEPVTPDDLRSGKLRNIHIATMRPGAVRGNHRHAAQTEGICFSGRIRLVVQDRGGENETLEFRDDECVRITIAPGIAHAFLNYGDVETFIVCYADFECGKDEKESVQIIHPAQAG